MRDEDGNATIRRGAFKAIAAGGGCVVRKQGVLSLGVERGGWLVEHEQQRPIAHQAARQRELLPLPERQLDPARPRRAELSLQPYGDARHDVVSTGPLHGGGDGSPVVETGDVTQADRLASGELEAEEVLEGASQARAPQV